MLTKFFTVLFFSLVAVIPTSWAGSGEKVANSNQALQVWPKTLMLRVKPEYRAALAQGDFRSPAAQRLFNELGKTKFFARFPHRAMPKSAFHFTGERIPDMTLIYQMHYSREVSEAEAARVAMNSGLFEYAEPKYIRRTTFVPNDPRINQQYYLDSIQVFQAWDITQGDTNVVMGIVDSGVQTNHNDLASQIKIDPNEPINGLDDNNDGKIDNNRGWDFCGPTFNINYPGDNDPNITQGGASHGTHVAGISGARTHNGAGIAGVGFKCKLMALKCAPDDGGQSIYYGYEAIEYGASHGCQVLNCSWGGEGGYSLYEQEVITDATLTFNCLVVAAAGNDNSPNLFFPAYYKHVLAVSALGPGNVRANFTNYNYAVRVAAPGVNIMSTYFNNGYQNNSGTSMASPVVAGVAGLVRSQFPLLTADQVAQRIRVTSDNVYSVAGNTSASLFGKLGRGIVNAYRAVSEPSPGIKNLAVRVTDNNNDIFQPNDTLYISADFINYLDNSSPNLKVKFSVVTSATSAYITQIASTSEYVLGEMTMNEIKNNNGAPFKIYLRPNLPNDRTMDLRMYYSDGNYYDYDHYSILLNPTYINVEKNNISTTVTSKGRIGFNNDASTEGLGFQHKRRQTLYELGLMTGTSATKMASTVRNATTGAGAAYDNHYRSVSLVRETDPPFAQAYQYMGITSDANANAAASNIHIIQNALALTTAADSNYILVRQQIVNKSTTTPLTNFYIGYFGDFDISVNGQQDRAGWSANERLGYAYNTNQGGLYAGISILGDANPHYYAIDNDATAADTFGVYDGFTNQEKFTALSSGIYRKNAGVSTPKDVSMVVGAGPYSIAPGDTIQVGFAIVAGENLEQIQQAAQQAQNMWTTITSTLPQEAGSLSKMRIFPNPAAGELYLSGSMTPDRLIISDAYGKTIPVMAERIDDQLIRLDITHLPPGIYHLGIKGSKDFRRFIRK